MSVNGIPGHPSVEYPRCSPGVGVASGHPGVGIPGHPGVGVPGHVGVGIPGHPGVGIPGHPGVGVHHLVAAETDAGSQQQAE